MPNRSQQTDSRDKLNKPLGEAKGTPLSERMAHKAEHAVDMETGAVIAIRVQPADTGDTHTMQETRREAKENIEAVAEVIHSESHALAVEVERPAELVTDKGYHSREVVRQLAEAGIRSYISEPERGRQRWRQQSAEQAAVYGNRRRIRGERGKRLQRQRGEKLERTMAHLYETGRRRRVHLRGHSNILKRLLIHACGLNLGVLMRRLYGVGTPRGLQGGGFKVLFLFFLLLSSYSRTDCEQEESCARFLSETKYPFTSQPLPTRISFST
ncbi:MAG: transposase [Acidobacteriaceae bacterium]|nr:transposase [Acidobacteriaceae bacterium]